MKLLRRSRSSGSGALPARRAELRTAPPSVVTAWLRQGLRSGMCPLCRVAHKADREYIWHFFDDGADQGEAIDAVRGAYGFCAEHIEILRRTELDGMRSTLALGTVFADTFAGIVEDLESLSLAATFRRATCPACANRDERVRTNAQYLLDELATSPRRRERFELSPGLCFAHFELVWNEADSREERELILAAQRRAARAVLHELREDVRKQDDKFRHEPKGAERDSWRRAILMTAGWPPPTPSAAEPERERWT